MKDPLGEIDKMIAGLKQKKSDEQSRQVISTIQTELVNALKPVFKEMMSAIKDALSGHTDAIGESLRNIKIDAPTMPDIHVPEFKMPEIKIPQPIVNVAPAAVNIPPYPEQKEFDGNVHMASHAIEYKKPMPVILVDSQGRPYVAGNFSPGGGGGGGRTIQDILDSKGHSVMDPTNTAVRVNVVAGSTAGATGQGDAASATRVVVAGNSDSSVQVNSWNGNTVATGDGETTSGVLRVILAQDAAYSVFVNGATGTIAAAIVDSSGVAYSGSNPVPTSGTATLSAATGQGDGAVALRIIQAGDTVSSVIVNNPQGAGELATALRTTQAGDAVSSVSIVSITGPIAQGDSASALRIVHAGDVATSVSVVGATGTIMTVGDIGELVIDNNEAPVKMGGIAASTNRTRATDGQRRSISLDLAGRQIVVDQGPRELETDTLTLLTTGIETSVMTQVAGVFLDIVSITAVNQSAGAWAVKFNESSAGGNRYTLMVPANDTRGVVFKVPLKQTTAARDWTATLVGSDISNSNLTIIMQAMQNT